MKQPEIARKTIWEYHPSVKHGLDMSSAKDFKLVLGNSNRSLGEAVARHLGVVPAKAVITRFADQEVSIEELENARGREIFILQSTSNPPNENIMELLVLMDALRRGSARRLSLVIPYFGYSRQDRKTSARAPISARLIANLLEATGADRIMTIDLHAAQIQGFFNKPVDNLYARPAFIKFLQEQSLARDEIVVVSPDVGGVARARSIAERLGCDLAIIDKRRERAGHSEVMNVVGNVAGRACFLIDDIIDSGGTICNAANAMLEQGATSVSAFATHGVLSNEAVNRINQSALHRLYITDSIEPRPSILASPKIEIISLSRLIATAIHNTYHNLSISELF